jgi:hypothetical protein
VSRGSLNRVIARAYAGCRDDEVDVEVEILAPRHTGG